MILPRTVKSVAATAACAVVGTLTLTACGGSGDSGGDKISTAGTAPPSATASPSTTAPATAPPGAPAVKLPADLKVEITDPPAGQDAAAQKAIGDLKYALMALQDGFAQQNGQTPGMLHAYGMQPGLYWSKQIHQFKDADRTVTGTDRFYNIDMKVTDGKSAVAHYCEDQRKEYSKNVKTGKISVTTPSDKDFYRFTLSMGLDAASGVWKIQQENWTQGDKSCVTP